MKFGQIIFSVVVSVLIFAAVLVTENARFSFKINIKNPFNEAQELNTFIENNKKESFDILSKKGEFFRLYPNSVMDFSENNRNLIDGEFFISSQFISDRDLLSAQKNFISPFNSSLFKPKISQFKIGKIFISIPNASVYIKRDQKKETLKIFALDHSIEVFLQNSKSPFVLPANMMIDIKEGILNDKTGYLYYTKLKKELKLTTSSLNLSLLKKEDLNSLSSKAILALKSKNLIEKKIRYYAKNIPNTWIWYESQNFIGSFSTFIQKIQINLSIGYPKEKIKQFKINKILKHFVLANNAVNNNDIKNAEILLNKFNSYFKTKNWFKLIFNSSFEEEWNLFVHIHKVWIRSLLPSDPANIFIKFWNPEEDKNSFIFIKNKFNSIELLLPKKQYTKAANYLVEISKSINSIKLNKRDLNSITKLRRILFELIKDNEVFQKKEVFELYGFFIRKEIEYYEGEEKDEIQLESAQNILFFINIFLNKEDKADISTFLVKIYGILNIDEITKKRNRLRIFTEKELELIKIIKNIGSTGLTENIIKAFNKQKEIEAQRQKLDKLRLNNKDDNQIINTNLINTKELFLNYLNNLDINIQKIKIIEKNSTYKFTNALFNDINISGTFNIESQKFDYLKVGTEIEKNINKKIIKILLIDMSKNNFYKPKKTPTKKTVHQNTPRAITERDSVKNWFDGIGVFIDFSNISIVDFNYNKFKIKDATYNNQVRLSFIYYKDLDILENLIIQSGRTPLEISEKIKRTNLKEKIDKYLYELIN